MTEPMVEIIDNIRMELFL